MLLLSERCKNNEVYAVKYALDCLTAAALTIGKASKNPFFRYRARYMLPIGPSPGSNRPPDGGADAADAIFPAKNPPLKFR